MIACVLQGLCIHQPVPGGRFGFFFFSSGKGKGESEAPGRAGGRFFIESLGRRGSPRRKGGERVREGVCGEFRVGVSNFF